MKLRPTLNITDSFMAVLGLAIGVGLLYVNGGWNVFRSPNPMSFMEYYLTNDIGLFLLPLLVMTLLGKKPSDYGMTMCSPKHSYAAVIAGGLFFPALMITAKSPEFQTYYLVAMRQSGAISGMPIEINVIGIIKHQIILVSYMFAWEWFFRGFLINSIKRVSGSSSAVIVQAILFTVMHLGKPNIEVVSSFLGAVILGLWALRSQSIVPCFIVHALLTILNDVAVLIHAR